MILWLAFASSQMKLLFYQFKKSYFQDPDPMNKARNSSYQNIKSAKIPIIEYFAIGKSVYLN